MNIYQRINAVMKEVAYVKKDARVQGYSAVTHDNVTAVLRPHLIEHGIVVQLEQLKSDLLERRDKERGISMHLYSGDYAVHFVNIEKPDDRLTVTINSHAADNGDKAPGKAASYATKYAMLKAFSLETGENEESRYAETPQYTDEQKDRFDELVETEDALGLAAFQAMVGPDIMTGLHNSFPKGHISKGKAKVRELTSAGMDKAMEYAAQIKECIQSEDPAVGELVDELTPDERRLIARQLNQTEIEYLRNVK